MHRHMEPHQWAFAFGDPDDRNGWQLFGCPRCSAARGDLEAWLTAVAGCLRCWPAFAAYEPLPPEVLDCDRCLASYAEFESWLEQIEHFEPLVAPEWVTALDLLEEVARQPVEAQIARVKGDSVYHQWGLCQRLLAGSQSHWFTDPHRAHDLARVGAAVADRLRDEEYHPRWTADLRSKAHAYLANTLRLLGDYARSETEFTTAEGWAELGVGQGRAEATLLRLKASLLLDQYRHLEAEALLDRVERYYREHEQHRERGKALLKLAMVSRARGLLNQASERVEEALSLIDPVEDPDLALVGRHNLVRYRIDSGDAIAARKAFEDLAEPTDRLLRLRRKWLAADLLRLEGDLEGAGRLYDDVRIGYLAEELHYNVALASLDLAIVATLQDRGDAVRELARDAVVLLTRAGAPQEAFAAIRLLVDALERESVSVAFIDQIARRLTRVRPRSRPLPTP